MNRVEYIVVYMGYMERRVNRQNDRNAEAKRERTNCKDGALQALKHRDSLRWKLSINGAM